VALLAINSASLEGLGPAFTSLDHALTGSGSALPALLAPSGGCRLGSRIHQIRSRRNRRANQRSQDGRCIAWAHGGGLTCPCTAKSDEDIHSIASRLLLDSINQNDNNTCWLPTRCVPLERLHNAATGAQSAHADKLCRPVSTRARTCWSKLARRRSCDNASVISGRSRCDLSGARRRGRGD
jgi:hypothetical protein